MSTRLPIDRRVVWLVALGGIVALGALLAVLTPVAWATPPQDRLHQTVPVGGALCLIPQPGITCTSPPGDFSFTVSPDSPYAGYYIRIRPPGPGETPPPGSGFVMVDHAWVVEIVDGAGNVISPVNFSLPARVCIKYTADDLAAAGGDPNNFHIRFYNATTGLWEDLTPLTVDTANKTVCAPVTHLTLFALFAKAPAALPVTGASEGLDLRLALLAVALLGLGLVWVVRRTNRAHA